MATTTVLARRLGPPLGRAATSRPALVLAVLTIGLWAVLAAAQEGLSSPRVEAVRLGVDAEGQTRIVLDMDARPVFAITPRADASGAPSLAVRVDGASFAGTDGVGLGAVAGYAAEGEVLTLALDGAALPVRSFVIPPKGEVARHRLVIDVDAVEPEVFAEAARDAGGDAAPAPGRLAEADPAGLAPPPSLKPDRPKAPIARADRPGARAKIVVVDPGHGGHDPGASGPNGLHEEEATLAAAETLRTVLTARGYEVILTREDDSFVPLGERIERARAAHADLFLSLHADAHGDPRVRGASVYTLSEKRSARMARELKGSGDFAVYDVTLSDDEADVGDILFDLAASTTRNESGRLAAALVDELSGAIPMVGNTHRRASLKVLLSPDVPAVLVEMAFVSNPEDEANLRSARWRRRAMGAVADGIDGYFGERVAVSVEAAAAGG